ncbi:hypothetical protein AB8O38_11365 [Saccharomonospora xinjiangensis]|uniref:hypothetical protein n=1 Tax=Saccharomonospora xinjiangensis TaxID=75294 RepID=UPI00351057BF
MPLCERHVREIVEFTGPYAPVFWSISWETIEKRIGHALPSDYKKICDVVPPGKFSDFFVILHPVGSDYGNLLRVEEYAAGELRRLLEIYSADDVPDYVEEYKLFPCLLTDNGDTGYWLADSDDPDEWTVVVSRTRSAEWWNTGLSLSSLIHAHISAEDIAEGPFGSVFEDGEKAEFEPVF